MLYESNFNDDFDYKEVTEMLEVIAEFDEDFCEFLILVLDNAAGYVLGVCGGNVNREVCGVIVMFICAVIVVAAIRMFEAIYEMKNETLGKIE